MKKAMPIVLGMVAALSSAALALEASAQGGQQAGGAAASSRGTPSALDGRGMFQLYCTSCHGKEGKGDGPAAAALKNAPADLTRISVRNAGTFPADKVRRFIEGREAVAGHGTREMPVWGGLFAGIDRDSEMATIRVAILADYLKSIQQR